ncbi:MAG: universal stress protein, partial [Armatimonadetes bacterium]|nr:universal stress protein [Armatimonadota bacterium]
ERHLAAPEEACAYLDEVGRRWFPAGVPVERHTHTTETSSVARSIAEHVTELGGDLVVMCTHGRGGVRGFLFGSIAQQVVARSVAPVLLIRPDPAGAGKAFACSHILAPLDGTEAHEHGLPVAVELATACGAALHLTVVVPTLGTLPGEHTASGILLPSATRAVLDLAEEQATDYLRRRVAEALSRGLAVTGEVRRGDPTATLVRAAQDAQADLVVLGTHGKAGSEAFWAGSTAPKLCRRLHAPLLLVPLAKGEEQD